jgi:hypothetical protein
MYKDKFVLSVLHDGSPVKENGRRSKKEVAIPFDSEYRVRLKNKNDRSCTARVSIDGRKVSQLGDFIIHAGGSVDLERFVDRSMDSGKKFKFVPLDHEDVDDPTSSNNGIIKVEFRLAKTRDGNKMLPPRPWPDPPDTPGLWTAWPCKEDNNGPKWVDPSWNDGTAGGNVYKATTTSDVYYHNSSGDHLGSICSFTCDSTPIGTMRKMKKSVDAGATIEGGKSSQSFTYSDLEVDNSHVVTLRLKIVGINKERPMNKYKYCANCGTKVNRKDRYCSNCGHRRGNSA